MNLQDLDPIPRSLGLIVASNCLHFEAIQQAIKDNDTDKALRLCDRAMQQNFETLIVFAKHYGLDETSLMSTLLNELSPPS